MATDGALAEIVSGLVAPRAPRYVGLAVAAVADGTCEQRQAGRRDDSGSPVEETSIFEIGSVTKVFTALMLADLVVADEVALDDPLAESYPELDIPVSGRPVTLGDLATHTSGFPRLPRGLYAKAIRNRDDPYSRFTEADVAAALEGLRLRRAPGKAIRYSNFGAAVLGEALARRRGTSYADLLAERVTGPLGLRDTAVEVVDPVRRAHGHDRRGKPVPDWDMTTLPGMGALHSTATDLARFAAAQLHPESTPLGEAIRLSQRVHAGEGERLQVGLGWMVTPVGRPGSGFHMHWHNGGTGGARSFFGFVPDRRVAVAVLTNCARSVDRLGTDLLKQLAN